MASCWFLGTGAASPRAEGPRWALSGARSDQPSHTLPPVRRSPCHGRVARADVSTSGAQDRLLSSVSPTLADSLLTTRLPSPPRAGPGEASPPPVCTAQARGRCWEAAKRRVGTHRCDVSAIFIQTSLNSLHMAQKSAQNIWQLSYAPSQQRDLLASDQTEGAPPPWGQGSRKGRRGCAGSPVLSRDPPWSARCHSPDPCVARMLGTRRPCPMRRFVFREEGSTELSEILRVFLWM